MASSKLNHVKIVDLTVDMPNWQIIGRLSSVSPVNAFKSKNKTIHYFHFDILDDTGEIHVTSFDVCLNAYESLRQGKVII